MIKSMTGYGKSSGSYKGISITAELRSVNSKMLDLNLRTPSRYRNKDSELKAELSKDLERGKIDFYVYVESTEAIRPVTLNRELLKGYYSELVEVKKELGLPETDLLSILIKLPEVLSAEAREEPEAEEWNELLSVCRQACEAFNNFRVAEGINLEKDFRFRIANIEASLLEIEKLEGGRLENIRNRINRNLSEVFSEQQIDRNRFEQELIYYLEKLDITEEKTRLRSHCSYFIQTLEEKVSNGRKLGFISQEIGREINTIGSKANDAPIQRIVVQMKDELEKVKEQVLNVL
jgi:uncharacterized protein (TIGR00255 family)